jgi:hypothetical protein
MGICLDLKKHFSCLMDQVERGFVQDDTAAGPDPDVVPGDMVSI